MSVNGNSLLFFLRRCVAARHATLSAGIKTPGSVSAGSRGFSQSASTRTRSLPSLSRLQSAASISQHSLCTKAGDPQEYAYPPLPTYQAHSEPEKKEVYIVQAKGFPWSCTAEDLLHFFSECRIRDGVKGVHLTVNQQGKPSGQAFIEMEHEEDVSKALEKHRQYLGPRYVEVYEVTESDAEDMLKKSALAPASDGVVRLRGLPFSCTEADILLFFSGLDVAADGVTIVRNHRGRNSGEAFVRFSSQEVADDALQRDRELIGNRYIEVFPSSSSEIRFSSKDVSPLSDPWSAAATQLAAKAAVRETVRRASTCPPTRSHQSSVLHRVRMRGLPFHATGQDIVQFFSPLALSKVLVEYGPDGRTSGEADAFFSCHQDAVAAMSRDRLLMGGRYIELFLNSAPETSES